MSDETKDLEIQVIDIKMIPEQFKKELEDAKNKIFGWFNESKYMILNYFDSNSCFYDSGKNEFTEEKCHSISFVIDVENDLLVVSYTIEELYNDYLIKSLNLTYIKDDESEQLTSGDLSKETFNKIILDMFSIILNEYLVPNCNDEISEKELN